MIPGASLLQRQCYNTIPQEDDNRKEGINMNRDEELQTRATMLTHLTERAIDTLWYDDDFRDHVRAECARRGLYEPGSLTEERFAELWNEVLAEIGSVFAILNTPGIDEDTAVAEVMLVVSSGVKT
jgi:hypothetical protein